MQLSYFYLHEMHIVHKFALGCTTGTGYDVIFLCQLKVLIDVLLEHTLQLLLSHIPSGLDNSKSPPNIAIVVQDFKVELV